MFKKNFRSILGLLLVLFVAGSLATGCYDDSELRASINDLKSQLDQLKTLVSTLQNDDAVTGVTQNSDGSYTITFKKSGAVTIKNGENGKNGNDGKDGKDGKDGSIVSVTKNDNSYIFTFSDGTTVVLPRYSEIRVLTFEDADYKGPEETTSYWSSLIDDPQYGGELLYGNGCVWLDKNHTFLSGNVEGYDPQTYSGGFSGGGTAISNYGNGQIDGIGYDHQLEVYNSMLDGAGRSGCGHNGSDNFAVVYDPGEVDWMGNPLPAPCIGFLDNVPRVIESVFVTNTAYVLNSLVNGDQYTAPMADDGFFFVEAIGTNNLGEITGTARFYLANTRFNFVTQWTKWDLSGLGEVIQVDFRLGGSKDLYGDYGFNVPRYVAFDDFAVRVYPD